MEPESGDPAQERDGLYTDQLLLAPPVLQHPIPVHRPPGHRRGVLGTVAGAVLAGAVACAAVIVVVVALTRVSATTMAERAGRDIGAAGGVAVSGSVDGDHQVLTVTRSGTATGLAELDGYNVDRLTIRGVTYLRAPSAYWVYMGALDSASPLNRLADGHWARAASASAGMSLDPLTPEALARGLESVGKHPRTANGVVNGIDVMKIAGSDNRVYDVTTTSPYRLIHVSTAGSFDADVSGMTPAETRPIFTTLHNDVHHLQGALDTAATYTFPSTLVSFALDCRTVGSSGCTITVAGTVVDPDRVRMLARMTATFSHDRSGGEPFGTCATTTPAASDVPVRATCTLSGGHWTSWRSTHLNRFWVRPQLAAVVNSAADISALQNYLNADEASDRAAPGARP